MDKEKFKRSFEEAKTRYKELQGVSIELMFGNGWFFTMRAGMELSSMFKKRRKYFIKVNLNRKDVLSELSHDDLIGWFGHELAHIIEYETMSNSKLFGFILRYVFDLRYRFSVEKRVNTFTCNNGFAKELFGVWKHFLAMDTVHKKYKRYITKHYCPAWKTIRESAESQGVSKETYESLATIP